MSCAACNKKISSNRHLQCVRCRSKYHAECLNLKNEQFYALSGEYLSNWVCPLCSNITNRSKQNDNTPVRKSQVPYSDLSMNMSYDTSDQSVLQCSVLSCADTSAAAPGVVAAAPAAPAPATAGPPPAGAPAALNTVVTMEKIGALLDQKLNNILGSFMHDFRKALKDDVKILVREEIRATVSHLKDEFTATTNFICEDQAAMKKEIVEKARTIKTLENQIVTLQIEQRSLSSRISSMERMTRSQNIEIQAVPESKNENPIGLFNNLCKILKLDISPDQIHSCRRVAKLNSTSDRPRNLLVTLVNPGLRDSVLSACYRYNKTNKGDLLNSSHLGLACNKQRIYVTEHLSPECKALHAAARKAAKEKGFKYVWVKYGRVYMRKNDGANCVLVKNLETLNNLI